MWARKTLTSVPAALVTMALAVVASPGSSAVPPGAQTGPTFATAVSAPFGKASSPPHVVDTISLPGTQPAELAWYASGNRLFVTDDSTGDLLVVDGSSRQVIASVPVGHNAFNMVVNETAGRVYVASEERAFGAEFYGTGLISVIDADTAGVVATFDPPCGDWHDSFALANDEVRDRIYVACDGPWAGVIGVIDAATGQWTTIDDDPGFGAFGVFIAVNTVTNELFVAERGDDLSATGGDWMMVVDGETLATERYEFPGALQLQDLAVNDVENKVYATMLTVPGQDEPAIMIHDRDTGGSTYVGDDYLAPLVFDRATNTLFAGSGSRGQGAIVDGATDQLTYVDDFGGFVGSVASSTDNAYFVSIEKTYVVNAATGLVWTLSTGHPAGGGVFSLSIAIDQARGLVYVVNDDHDGIITVIEDGVVALLDQKVLLEASRKVVTKGRRVRLTATVSPCTGNEDYFVVFQKKTPRGWRFVANVFANDVCKAKTGVLMKKTTVFRAVSEADQEHSAGISNKVEVRVRR